MTRRNNHAVEIFKLEKTSFVTNTTQTFQVLLYNSIKLKEEFNKYLLAFTNVLSKGMRLFLFLSSKLWRLSCSQKVYNCKQKKVVITLDFRIQIKNSLYSDHGRRGNYLIKIYYLGELSLWEVNIKFIKKLEKMNACVCTVQCSAQLGIFTLTISSFNKFTGIQWVSAIKAGPQ